MRAPPARTCAAAQPWRHGTARGTAHGIAHGIAHGTAHGTARGTAHGTARCTAHGTALFTALHCARHAHRTRTALRTAHQATFASRWALELLPADRLSYAAACQTIGMSAGNALGHPLLLAVAGEASLGRFAAAMAVALTAAAAACLLVPEPAEAAAALAGRGRASLRLQLGTLRALLDSDATRALAVVCTWQARAAYRLWRCPWIPHTCARAPQRHRTGTAHAARAVHTAPRRAWFGLG